MVVASVLFALFTIGIVVPCLIDVATSPPWAIRTLSKRAWVIIAVAAWVPGCVAWLISGRPRRLPLRGTASYPARGSAGLGMGPAEAFRRHPAGRSMGLDLDGEVSLAAGSPRSSGPLGPDDDPQFLLELEARIRELRDDA